MFRAQGLRFRRLSAGPSAVSLSGNRTALPSRCSTIPVTPAPQVRARPVAQAARRPHDPGTPAAGAVAGAPARRTRANSPGMSTNTSRIGCRPCPRQPHRVPAQASAEEPALLQGLAVCGRCGARMTVNYHRRGPTLVLTHHCHRLGQRLAEPTCQGIDDAAIGELLVSTVTPLAMAVALAVRHNTNARRDDAAPAPAPVRARPVRGRAVAPAS